MADDSDSGWLWYSETSQNSIGEVTYTNAILDQVAHTSMAEADLKADTQSPTANQRFSYSRSSSIGSLPGISHSSASSAHNTDDEDSDTQSTSSKTASNYKDRRREAHTQAEQKRRDAIKKGYDELQTIVPTCHNAVDAVGTQKLSKAAVLQRSIDYIQYLVQQKKKQEEDLESLRKEVLALKIMKANYEHIVKAHQSTPQHGQNQVPDEVKFQVFQQMMDALFQSFNASISVANFAELSGCIFSWLEEYCKPQSLRELVLAVLRQTTSQMNL
ncbi:max-like protein X isoform X2 [Lingula anatina]|uniref:Max-like protein X n=1 Tax=Lingula anatina TaxID=7574 RepID=A0A1S3H236_LINAN|nr:max-like protein X isoform X2 [Lingula anatina]XP_013388202.1 max-like protein X isoform X2 [Lingula anatina]|eukprot:XP_013380190.1 max-like protein X isoform X2 [Lingula anatina]